MPIIIVTYSGALSVGGKPLLKIRNKRFAVVSPETANASGSYVPSRFASTPGPAAYSSLCRPIPVPLNASVMLSPMRTSRASDVAASRLSALSNVAHSMLIFGRGVGAGADGSSTGVSSRGEHDTEEGAAPSFLIEDESGVTTASRSLAPPRRAAASACSPGVVGGGGSEPDQDSSRIPFGVLDLAPLLARRKNMNAHMIAETRAHRHTLRLSAGLPGRGGAGSAASMRSRARAHASCVEGVALDARDGS